MGNTCYEDLGFEGIVKDEASNKTGERNRGWTMAGVAIVLFKNIIVLNFYWFVLKDCKIIKLFFNKELIHWNPEVAY